MSNVSPVGKISVLAGAALAVACLAGQVSAAEWTNSASVTPGITYTDNVCLSKDNEQDQWIGLVTPAGTVVANGSRANLSLDGSVEINSLSDSELQNLGCVGGNYSNREQFAPQLTGNADAILVDHWFYLDAGTIINQNQASPFISGGNDSLDRTGNTNTTYSYNVSPYIQRRFKQAAELNVRYTWDEQYNSVDVVGDSTEESAQALLGSVPGTSSYSWGLQGDYSKVDYSDTPLVGQTNQDSELKSAQLNLGYQLSRRWQVNGFYGDEWNDFVSSQDDIDGTYWDVGLRFTPNVRTTIEAGVGDRFFGNNPRFSITHSHKRSAFSASYAKTLTYDRDLRTLADSPPLNPDFPPPPGVDPGVTTVSNSPILDERYSLGYSYEGLRTRFGVSAFQSEQRQQSGGAEPGFTDSTFRGISVSASRDLTQQTALTAQAQWNEQKPESFDGSDINDNSVLSSESWIFLLGVSRRLSQATTLGLNYGYTDRQSDSVFDTYTENQITLDLKVDL